MKEKRIIYIPKEIECEVKYIVRIEPLVYDPHFAPDPEFLYKKDGKVAVFETKEEAKQVEEIYRDAFVKVHIDEKIIPCDYEEKWFRYAFGGN